MEFRIIYGRSGCGKTNYIFNEIKKKISGKNKIYIIVPEQYSFSAEKHLLDSIESNSSLNAEVLTLSRMADRVISETIGNNVMHLSKIGKSMIVYDVLEQLKNKLNFLKNTEKNMELATTMITELKKHNIHSDQIGQIIENIEDEYLKLKLKDSKNILEKYQEQIEGSFLDESDRLELLAQNIELVDFFFFIFIYIDEFAGFTPNEYNIIEKLCTLAKEVTVTLCTDSLETVENIDESIYYFNQITAEKLTEIAKRCGCFISKVNLGKSKRFASLELQALEENIYNSTIVKLDEKTKDLSLFIAKNPVTEIENVAKTILKLVKEKKYRYKDIAVVSADLDTYEIDIKEIFIKYNIPVFIDEKRDINGNILMKYIISLLNILSTNFSYESMFSYIKSGLLDIEDDDIFILEKYINKWGIRGSKWYKQDFIYEEKNDIQDRINKIRKQVVGTILDFKNRLTGDKTAREISANLYEFINENNIQTKINQMADEIEKKGETVIAEPVYSAVVGLIPVITSEIFINSDGALLIYFLSIFNNFSIFCKYFGS